MVTHTYNTGAALYIETGTERFFALEEFPANITLHNEPFTLRGIVAYLPGPTRSSLGHYVAFCRRSSVLWERCDDLANKVTTSPAKTKIQPHVIIYTKE